MRHVEIRFEAGKRFLAQSPREVPVSIPAPGADDGAELGIEELEPRLTPDTVPKVSTPKRTAGWGC